MLSPTSSPRSSPRRQTVQLGASPRLGDDAEPSPRHQSAGSKEITRGLRKRGSRDKTSSQTADAKTDTVSPLIRPDSPPDSPKEKTRHKRTGSGEQSPKSPKERTRNFKKAASEPRLATEPLEQQRQESKAEQGLSAGSDCMADLFKPVQKEFKTSHSKASLELRKAVSKSPDSPKEKIPDSPKGKFATKVKKPLKRLTVGSQDVEDADVPPAELSPKDSSKKKGRALKTGISFEFTSDQEPFHDQVEIEDLQSPVEIDEQVLVVEEVIDIKTVDCIISPDSQARQEGSSPDQILSSLSTTASLASEVDSPLRRGENWSKRLSLTGHDPVDAFEMLKEAIDVLRPDGNYQEERRDREARKRNEAYIAELREALDEVSTLKLGFGEECEALTAERKELNIELQEAQADSLTFGKQCHSLLAEREQLTFDLQVAQEDSHRFSEECQVAQEVGEACRALTDERNQFKFELQQADEDLRRFSEQCRSLTDEREQLNSTLKEAQGDLMLARGQGLTRELLVSQRRSWGREAERWLQRTLDAMETAAAEGVPWQFMSKDILRPHGVSMMVRGLQRITRRRLSSSWAQWRHVEELILDRQRLEVIAVLRFHDVYSKAKVRLLHKVWKDLEQWRIMSVRWRARSRKVGVPMLFRALQRPCNRVQHAALREWLRSIQEKVWRGRLEWERDCSRINAWNIGLPMLVRACQRIFLRRLANSWRIWEVCDAAEQWQRSWKKLCHENEKLPAFLYTSLE